MRLTNDLLNYRVLSLSRDGRLLVTVPYSERSDIFVMPRDGSSDSASTAAFLHHTPTPLPPTLATRN